MRTHAYTCIHIWYPPPDVQVSKYVLTYLPTYVRTYLLTHATCGTLLLTCRIMVMDMLKWLFLATWMNVAFGAFFECLFKAPVRQAATIHTYMHTHAHTYTYIHAATHIHAHMCMHMHTCACTCTHAHVHTCTCA